VLGQCINPAPECTFPIGENSFAEFFPFSFTATNTQLGEISASGGATASGPNIGEGNGGSVQAFATQSATANTDAFETSLSGFFSALYARAFSVNLSDGIAVSFNLTQESEVQVSSCLPLIDQRFSYSGMLLDSKGNVILTIQPFGVSSCGGSSVSALLQPGTDQLDESTIGSASVSLQLGFAQDFRIDLNATFTPVVPEPRWTILAGLFAALCVGCAISRRRRAAQL
jgi:hypothetical protein